MTVPKVHLLTVEKGADVRTSAYKLLESVEEFSAISISGKKVLLKPNFVAPFEMAVTGFDIIAATADFIRSRGGTPFIAESSGFEFNSEETFKILGVYEFGKNENIEIINLDHSDFRSVKTGDPAFPTLLIAEEVFKADLIFNLPRLKRHSLTDVTFSVKNLMGLIHRDTRRIFHAKNIDHGIAVLNQRISPSMTMVDGIHTLTRAVYGKEQYQGLIIAGTDPLSVDKACCKILGVNSSDISHLAELDSDEHSFQLIGEYSLTDSWKPKEKKIYKAIFKTAYMIDKMLSSLSFKQSIIPQLHWYLGIRPAVGNADKKALEKGAQICPVNAIDAKNRKIIKSKCINIRCLKCIDIKPEGSFITKKGFTRIDG